MRSAVTLMPSARRPLLAAAAALLAIPCATAQDLVIPAGTAVVYDTDVLGRAQFGRVEIQLGGVLFVRGSRPFSLIAGEVIIDGVLDASGISSPGVVTLNTTNVPELGAPGALGAGHGGTGSYLTGASTPRGGDGFGSYGVVGGPAVGGGEGGESSYSTMGRDARRAAGGGGGALAANQPVVSFPQDPANLGLVATAGFGGGASGTGAVSQTAPAQGGAPGDAVFVDADPLNDFWGRKPAPAGVIVGEARRPLAGRGGGAGGDAVSSATFPPPSFVSTGDEKGAGGGAGGGLVAILARTITVGPFGELRANGGDGGGGENTFFFNRVGGGSGGGSGGWIILDAQVIDLSAAGPRAIQALGGRGGPGRDNVHDVVGAGGNGGPGVIQLHVPLANPGNVLLPAGSTLDELAAPAPHLLLPILRP